MPQSDRPAQKIIYLDITSCAWRNCKQYGAWHLSGPIPHWCSTASSSAWKWRSGPRFLTATGSSQRNYRTSSCTASIASFSDFSVSIRNSPRSSRCWLSTTPESKGPERMSLRADWRCLSVLERPACPAPLPETYFLQEEGLSTEAAARSGWPVSSLLRSCFAYLSARYNWRPS